MDVAQQRHRAVSVRRACRDTRRTTNERNKAGRLGVFELSSVRFDRRTYAPSTPARLSCRNRRTALLRDGKRAVFKTRHYYFSSGRFMAQRRDKIPPGSLWVIRVHIITNCTRVIVVCTIYVCRLTCWQTITRSKCTFGTPRFGGDAAGLRACGRCYAIAFKRNTVAFFAIVVRSVTDRSVIVSFSDLCFSPSVLPERSTREQIKTINDIPRHDRTPAELQMFVSPRQRRTRVQTPA